MNWILFINNILSFSIYPFTSLFHFRQELLPSSPMRFQKRLGPLSLSFPVMGYYPCVLSWRNLGYYPSFFVFSGDGLSPIHLESANWMKIVVVVHLLSQDKLVVIVHLFPAPISSLSSIFSGDGLLPRTSSSLIVVLQELMLRLLMRGRREEKEGEDKNNKIY